jgi:hypothetical protein
MPNATSSGDATTALVLGIMSLLCLGFLSGVPAMIVARRATRAIDSSRGQLGGRGSATAGFVTGLIGTVVSGAAVGIVVLTFALGASVDTSFDSTCSTINPNPIDNPECYD